MQENSFIFSIIWKIIGYTNHQHTLEANLIACSSSFSETLNDSATVLLNSLEKKYWKLWSR